MKEDSLANIKTITGLIGTVLVILKVSGLTDLDWVYVISPFCVVTVFWTFFVIVGFMIGLGIGFKDFINRTFRSKK